MEPNMETKAIKVETATLRGADAVPVAVGACVMPGIPGVSIVGMAPAAVSEIRSRVRCALRSCGYMLPRASVVINLAPGEIRKAGSHLDLPIAVALLAATGQIPTGWLDGCLFAGELELDGKVRPASGAAAMAMLAHSRDGKLVTGAHAEVPSLCGSFLSLESLADLKAGRDGVRAAAPLAPSEDVEDLDFADIDVSDSVKRALAVAVAGGFGIALVGGTPEARLSIARRVPFIMPMMTPEEMRTAMALHSAAGKPLAALAACARPFRSPSPVISCAGLVGGGRPVRPGEASLAHSGVLYLEDIAKWDAAKLQTLRMPGREGCVRIVRAEGSYTMPTGFQLIAGCEECACGGYGLRGAECCCSETKVKRYRTVVAQRLSQLGVGMAVHVASGGGARRGLGSRDLRQMVARARAFSEERGDYEGSMTKDCADFIREFCGARGIDPMGLRNIARTIADMEESEHIRISHARGASVFALGRAV